MKLMHKFIFLKKYLPFFIALILHLIVLSFFLEKPRELVYPDVTSPKSGIQFNLKNNFKINYIGKTNFPSNKPIATKSIDLKTEAVKKSETNQTNGSNLASTTFSASAGAGSGTTSNAGSGSGTSMASSDFISYEEPIYPKIAREKNIQGKFSLKIYFQADGSVEKIEFLESTGSKILEESISKSIKKWKVKTNSPFSIVKKFEFKLNN